MNIIVLILILVFSYIILSNILSNILNKLTFRESMTNNDDIVRNIGENKRNIKNLKSLFNKTLQRSKNIYNKLAAAKDQTTLNNDAKSHPSIQSLNLKESGNKNCEDFQTMDLSLLNSLTEKHNDNKIEFATIESIIEQINDQIKKIKNKL